VIISVEAKVSTIKLLFMHRRWSDVVDTVHTSVLLKMHDTTLHAGSCRPWQLDAILHIFWTPGYIKRPQADKVPRFNPDRFISLDRTVGKDLHEQICHHWRPETKHSPGDCSRYRACSPVWSIANYYTPVRMLQCFILVRPIRLSKSLTSFLWYK
jgi:hypothetical protein